MTKQQYLSRPIVKEFIEWLKRCDQDFAHSYFNRRTKKNWKCKSLNDAFQKYNWSFKNSEGKTKFKYSDNENELNMLSEHRKSFSILFKNMQMGRCIRRCKIWKFKNFDRK